MATATRKQLAVTLSSGQNRRWTNSKDSWELFRPRRRANVKWKCCCCSDVGCPTLGTREVGECVDARSILEETKLCVTWKASASWRAFSISFGPSNLAGEARGETLLISWSRLKVNWLSCASLEFLRSRMHYVSQADGLRLAMMLSYPRTVLAASTSLARRVRWQHETCGWEKRQWEVANRCILPCVTVSRGQYHSYLCNVKAVLKKALLWFRLIQYGVCGGLNPILLHF